MSKKLKTFLIIFLISFSGLSCHKNIQGYKFPEKKFIKVALVLSGTIGDSEWNSSAYNGLKRFQTDYKADIAVVEKVSLEDAEKVFPKLAEKGFNLIIGNSYLYTRLLKKVALLYPNVFFCTISGDSYQFPNFCTFNFNNFQYGYLLGIVSGLNTSTNKVGFVVGSKTSYIEKIIVGFRRGLKSVNPKADLVVSYLNSWNDISKGREAAVNQINTGVDVISHFAELSGIGVIKAAEESDISAIGALVDQHDIAPTTVISSGIQDISQIIYLVCEHYQDRSLEPIAYSFGLKDQVIDIAPGYGNIDPTTETRINRIKAKLIEAESTEKDNDLKKRNRIIN